MDITTFRLFISVSASQCFKPKDLHSPLPNTLRLGTSMSTATATAKALVVCSATAMEEAAAASMAGMKRKPQGRRYPNKWEYKRWFSGKLSGGEGEKARKETPQDV